MNKEIATISRTMEIVNQYDLMPKKGYGQNFIIEPEIVRKIAREALLDKDTAVLEIGPGIGALTEQLSKIAGTVIAYEIDSKLWPVLEDTLSEYSNIEIIGTDVLKRDIPSDCERLLNQYKKVAVCANLPYYVTTPILFYLIDSKVNFSSMTFMVQKEMAERFTAKPNTKEYNGLSVILQYRYDMKVLFKVPPTVFYPKPAVDSIVVQFIPKQQKKEVDEVQFEQLIKACFVQRRKTIYNNLKEYYKDSEKAKMILEKAGIHPSRRAESLTLDEFCQLYEVTR